MENAYIGDGNSDLSDEMSGYLDVRDLNSQRNILTDEMVNNILYYSCLIQHRIRYTLIRLPVPISG